MKKVLTMDWERLIPGHPGAGGRQIGNAWPGEPTRGRGLANQEATEWSP